MFDPAAVAVLDRFATFGDLLKYLRRRAGLTQRQFSINVGYSDSQISRLELNQRVPDRPMILARFVPALQLEAEPELVSRLLELAAAVSVEGPPEAGPAPFKGLQCFEESDAEWFFGREVLSAKLVAHLADLAAGGGTRLLAVVGASGSGKSSVVRAGLIPALRRAGWGISLLTPTAQPLSALAVGARVGRERGRDGGPGRQLVVVDQLEELFSRRADEGERGAFIDRLMALAGGADGVCVLVALRADFYAACAAYPALRDALAARQEYIGPMTAGELRQAIEGPARRGGWELEPGLADLILRDLGAEGARPPEPGALPLLSQALLQTWERRRGRMLTLGGYQACGGVRGAIAETADAVLFDRLDADQRALTRQIFLRLTELGDEGETRRRASFDELVTTPEHEPAVREVLRVLADARLITTEQAGVEVAHEALIREWPALRAWLEENREDLRQQRALAQAAQAWQAAGRDPSFLLTGGRLAQAVEWVASTTLALAPVERGYFEASVAERERREREEAERRQREVETAHQLAQAEHARAESERRRADEQARSVARVRARNRLIAAAGALALVLAILAGLFGFQARWNAAQARMNLGVAQVANTQSAANAAQARANAAAAQANAATAQVASVLADQQRNDALDARATAQANLLESERQRLALEANAVLNLPAGDPAIAALLSLRVLKTGYLPLADAALLKALPGLSAVRVFSMPDRLWSAEFSPDGKYILTANDDGIAHLLDAATGVEVRRFVGHTTVLEWANFSADGRYVVTASGDGTARMWDVATGREIHQFRGHTDVVLDAVFSPDGRYVLTGSMDNTARLWDTATGREIRQFRGSTSWVFQVLFSPDGRTALTSNFDRTARLWDVATGQEIRRRTGPHEGWAADLSPDGRYALISWADMGAELWDTVTGDSVRQYPGQSGTNVTSVAFSPDGKYFLTSGWDTTARLWEVATGEEIQRFAGHTSLAKTARFSPDGQYVLTAGWDHTVRLWEMGLNYRGHAGPIYSVAFSPDQKHLLTASIDHTSRLWDAATGQEMRRFDGHTGILGQAAFSPDGKYVLTGGEDAIARLWDASTGREVRQFSGHTAPITSVAFSPDGKAILTGSRDRSVRLWDLATGTSTQVYLHQYDYFGYAAPVLSAFVADGESILTTALDALWLDPATGGAKDLFQAHDSIVAMSVSPDGRYALLAVDADMAVYLVDLIAGGEARPLTGPPDTAYSVAFSPNGKYALASGGEEVWVWAVDTGQPVRIFRGPARVRSIAYSPDGSLIAAATDAGGVQLWDADYRDSMARACRRLLRDLTDEERQQYGVVDAGSTCLNWQP